MTSAQEMLQPETRSIAIGDILSEAALGRCLILSSTDTGKGQGGRLARDLRRKLATLGGKEPPFDPGEGLDEATLLSDCDLDHASRWERAGLIWESVLDALLKGARFSHVLCLDPWAACLLTPTTNPLPDAKWIYVRLSDLPEAPAESEYWPEMDRWIAALPFAVRVDGDDLTATDEHSSMKAGAQFLPEQNGSAWAEGPDPDYCSRWLSLAASNERARRELEVALVAEWDGSILALNSFLSTVVRQDLTPTESSVLLLVSGKAADIDRLVAAHQLAHPRLNIRIIDAHQPLGENLRTEVKTFVLTNTAVLLPPTFLRETSRACHTGVGLEFRHVCVTREASAHVLVGNLDLGPDYSALVSASIGAPAVEASRGEVPTTLVLPSGSLDLKALRDLPAEAAMRSVREHARANRAVKRDGLVLLKLGDL